METLEGIAILVGCKARLASILLVGFNITWRHTLCQSKLLGSRFIRHSGALFVLTGA